MCPVSRFNYQYLHSRETIASQHPILLTCKTYKLVLSPTEGINIYYVTLKVVG
jgi:hypothetical protein